MEESKRIELINLATEDIFLRYPNYNLRINYSNEYGTVFLETFVKDEKSNLLVYTTDNYRFYKPFNFEVLTKFKDRFLSKCKMNRIMHIFTDYSAIKEPYIK
jgi:hypothetical protein